MPQYIVVATQLSNNTEIYRTTKAALCSISYPPPGPKENRGNLYIHLDLFVSFYRPMCTFFLIYAFFFFVDGTMS